MKILTICNEYPPVGGGGATACRTLAEALVRKGHEVDVLTAAMADLPRIEVCAGVTIHRTPCVRRARHYSTTGELATWIMPALARGIGLIRRRGYDLLHCHFIVPGGIVAAVLARRSCLPLVLTAHGSDVPGYNPDRFALTHRLIAPVWSRIVNASTALTIPSAHLADLLARHTNQPLKIVPNPFDAGQANVSSRKNRILVAARLVERKGVQTLLSALVGLETNFEVVVAGDGPYRPMLERQAKESGLTVNFLGFVPRDTLREQYASSKIFILPSVQENFPMVLLEAMAHGCAIVTTSAPGCAEVVGDGGLVVPPGDVAALHDAIGRLVIDDALATELATRGRTRAQQFSSARISGLFEHLFETVLATRPSDATRPSHATSR